MLIAVERIGFFTDPWRKKQGARGSLLGMLQTKAFSGFRQIFGDLPFGCSADTGGLVRWIFPTASTRPATEIRWLNRRLAGLIGHYRKLRPTADAYILVFRNSPGTGTAPGRAFLALTAVVDGDDMAHAPSDQQNSQFQYDPFRCIIYVISDSQHRQRSIFISQVIKILLLNSKNVKRLHIRSLHSKMKHQRAELGFKIFKQYPRGAMGIVPTQISARSVGQKHKRSTSKLFAEPDVLPCWWFTKRQYILLFCTYKIAQVTPFFSCSAKTRYISRVSMHPIDNIGIRPIGSHPYIIYHFSTLLSRYNGIQLYCGDHSLVGLFCQRYHTIFRVQIMLYFYKTNRQEQYER